jgi:hypothetical protein
MVVHTNKGSLHAHTLNVGALSVLVDNTGAANARLLRAMAQQHQEECVKDLTVAEQHQR